MQGLVVSVSQSDLVPGCVCHRGPFSKSSDLTGTPCQPSCGLELLIRLRSLTRCLPCAAGGAACAPSVYFPAWARAFSRQGCIRNVLLANTVLWLPPCLTPAEHFGRARVALAQASGMETGFVSTCSRATAPPRGRLSCQRPRARQCFPKNSADCQGPARTASERKFTYSFMIFSLLLAF